MMFGPHDVDSAHSSRSMRWKIKRQSNDELRQKFVDQSVPQAEYLGLEILDNNLKWNGAREHYDFGEIDWDGFHAVLNGAGSCNHERMAARQKSYDEGEWIREAMLAYAEKDRVRTNDSDRL